MPLRGPAKTAYQREYMRQRRSNKPELDPVVRPQAEVPQSKEAKLAALRGLIGQIEGQNVNVPESVQPSIYELPVYDWHIHGPGTRVRVFRGGRWVEMTVPEGAEVGA